MNAICQICGGINTLDPRASQLYAGRRCRCAEMQHPTTYEPRQLTEEDVRRIVRDELKKLDKPRSS